MKKLKRKKAFAKFKQTLRTRRVLVLSLMLVSFLTLGLFYFKNAHAEAEADVLGGFTFNVSPINLIPAPDEASIKAAEDKKAAIDRQEEIARTREDKITRVINFLKSQKSKVANREIASIIVDKADENNVDFRVVVAIMGTESGYCNKSFYYNCFGFLNKVHYSSYAQAFNDIVPKISKNYIAKYGNNLQALSKAYGQHNFVAGGANMQSIVNKI